jgi:radical SAM protein with 4Fe4S-binding SPASM domain
MENNILTYRPKLPFGYFHKKIDSVHVITHPSRPSWVVSNNLGWEILKQCNGKNTVNDIIKKLMYVYNAPKEVIENDIAEFITSAIKSGIFDSQSKDPAIEKTKIDSVFLHLTAKCNLRCKHCYAVAMSEGGKELTTQEYIKFLEQFYAEGGKTVVVSGGEPLITKKLKKILEINSKAHIRLLTNATIIDERWAAYLAKFNISIQVSIDGSNKSIHDNIRGDGSFEASITGVEHLIRQGMQKRINFSTTIMKQNLMDLPNIFQLAKNMGISCVRFLPLRKQGNAIANWNIIQNDVTRKDYENFYRYVFEHAKLKYPELDIHCGLSGYVLDPKMNYADGSWCPVGKKIVIDTKGDVFPCALLMDEKFKMGNIKTNSIEDLKSNLILKNLRCARVERKNKIKKCSACMWKNFCQGSCMGEAYEKNNTIWDTDEFCEFRINLYEQSVIKLSKEIALKKHREPGEDINTECF